MTPQTVRSLAWAAVLGGVCWIVLAVTAVATESAQKGSVDLTTTGDYVMFGDFTAALGLTAAGLLALHAHQRGEDGRLGRIGSRIAMAGALGQFVVIGTIFLTGQEPGWFGIAAPLAILTWIAGSIVFGIAIRRARVMPGWVGIALPVATFLAIPGSEYGTSVLIGAFLIVVGTRIARATAAAEAPARGAAARA